MKKAIPEISLTLILLSFIAQAQPSIEVYGFLGHTGVDEEAWAGNTLREYEKFTSGYYLQVFPYSNDLFGIGVEYGYSYLLYYAFSDGVNNIERNVDATRFLAVFRLFPKKKLFFEGGLGYYFFDGFSDFTVALAAGYQVKITDNFSIPLKFRNNLIFDTDANIFQPGLDVGVAYRF